MLDDPEQGLQSLEDLSREIKRLSADIPTDELFQPDGELHTLIRSLKVALDREIQALLPPGQKWVVQVDDNYHFMDESERYTKGEYDTEVEAVSVAKAIVDDFLVNSYRPGMTAEDLFKGYQMYGEDPWITGSSFCARDYAKQRCREICARDQPG